MIGLNGAECQRQGRTATGENLSHVHCKIPATRGAKVLSLGLKENKHDVFSFSENLLLCSAKCRGSGGLEGKKFSKRK